jgi:hypothetical protein
MSRASLCISNEGDAKGHSKRKLTHLDDFRELHGLFRCTLQVFDREDLEARFINLDSHTHNVSFHFYS